LPILQRGRSTYGLYIPKAIVVALGWKEGDEILIEILPDKALKLTRATESRGRS